MSGLSFLPPTAYTLGAASLYLGFSAVLGVLLRKAGRQRSKPSLLLGVGYICLLFLPATVFVLARSGWPPALRLALLLIAASVLALGLLQPVWTPRQLWRPAFGRRYFAAAMALSAMWGFSLGLSAGAVFPMLVGASALAAGAAALFVRPRPS
jgi:hypothetical protein